VKLPDLHGAALLHEIRELHLGRCAPRILLLAQGPANEPRVLVPERSERAPSESQRRAMRRLAARRLVELSWKAEEVQTKRETLDGPLVGGLAVTVAKSRTAADG
jgi:hypothetical protein